MRHTIRLILVSALMALSVQAFSQGPGDEFARQWQERIESERIAFLTNEMSLTPKEAQAFWPLYNQAQKEQREAMDASFKAYDDLQKAVREKKGDRELRSLLEKYTRALDTGSINEKYLKEYLKVLSPEKVAKLYVGEEKFRQSQIHRLRQWGPQANAPQGNPLQGRRKQGQDESAKED